MILGLKVHFLRKMPLCRKLIIRTNVVRRCFSAKQNSMLVELEHDIAEKLSNKVLAPGNHPGILYTKRIALPTELVDYVKMSLADHPVKSVLTDSARLINYLKGRHAPAEHWEIKRKTENASNIFGVQNFKYEGKTKDEIENLLTWQNKKVKSYMKRTVYRWKPITYDKYTALQYLVGRAAPEYAVLMKIFSEIKLRVKDFHPQAFFDFGSGVGTGVWAARDCWGHSINEYFTVDTSNDMNNIARFILSEGRENGKIPLKKFFQREFLPANPLPYDVVLSAYSLFEQPSLKSRLQTVQTLWKKTKDFMILVEQGTNAGFTMLNEARDFILDIKEGPLVGHVFAPCPHDSACPRYSEDDTPCNFEVPYIGMKLTEKIEHKKEVFTYLILRKGERSDDLFTWPRIVRPVMIRSKRAICRMCCDDGKLREVIFTSKRHGKQAYACAKSSSWGDILPVSVADLEGIEETSEETPPE